jgi:2-isopropylmalate synthase
MTDLIRNTIQSGHVVIWEEVARDGAQAETLLSGKQRVKIAQAQAEIFGEHGPEHLIFAAGYPSICQEEFDIVCQVAEEVETCSVATHGRVIRSDIDLGIETMKRAKHGRVSFALPVSDKHCQIMLHKTKEETLDQAVEITKYAVDKADGIPIDVAFGVASRVDPGFLAHAATVLSEEGIATIKIGDSTGELFPLEVHRLFKQVMEQVPSDVVIAAHLHNDYGLALANYLETLRLGVRMVCSSWLGLGERVGLAATEQILMALAGDPEQLAERLGLDSELWLSPPDLKRVTPIAQEVSRMLNIPLKMTDPVISPTMNHTATGAYFNNPMAFKPFDPEDVLGIAPKLVLSHLSNHSIVESYANQLGYSLSKDEIRTTLKWVKTYAYQHNNSIIPIPAFKEFLSGL